MTKINMGELMADREAGTGIFADNDAQWFAYKRRLTRLPDLESAYIEAVETIKAIGVFED